MTIGESHKLVVSGKQAALYVAKKETEMATTLTVTAFIDVHVTRVSQLWGESPEFFRGLLRGNTKPSQLQLSATLSMYFRNDRNLVAAETYLNKALTLARDLFDDCDSPTTLQSGYGFALLAFSLKYEHPKQAAHFVSTTHSFLSSFFLFFFSYLFIFFLVFLSHQSKIGLSLLENGTPTSAIEAMRKISTEGLLKVLFGEPVPFPRPDMTAALQTLSPSASSASPSSSPIIPELTDKEEEEEEGGGGGPGPSPLDPVSPTAPLFPSLATTTLFPGLATSPIQLNPIFQLFARRKPYLFFPPQEGLPLNLQRKFFCAECDEFVREIIYNHLPHFGSIFSRIAESQLDVPPPAIPREVAHPLLAFLAFADDLSRDLEQYEVMRMFDGGFARCLIYQGTGDEANAVEVARQLLISTRVRLSEFHDVPHVRVIVPAFIACACLLQYGHLAEAEWNFDILESYTAFYASAKDALAALRFQKASLQPVQANSPAPAQYSHALPHEHPLPHVFPDFADLFESGPARPAKRRQVDGPGEEPFTTFFEEPGDGEEYVYTF